jgi:D-alanyl-D-alanine carboxypeptidase/V8-like Glu-specific endopeptidase
VTDNGVFPCTAFIVSKKYILTNYHCSTGILARVGATRIDVAYFVAGYTMTGIDAGTKKYTVIPTPIEFDEDLDYAVLEVLGDPSQEYGELRLASLVPKDGTPFWIIGHPHGEAQRISREKCRAGAPATSRDTLLHTCDTLPGNSGSPVIDVGLRQVVALHRAGISNDDVNQAILMSKILEKSTILAAYTAPDAVPKAEPKTAANAPCDALYSAAAEAKACYAYDVYINSCPAHMLAPMARGYVQEFCQPQETVKLDKPYKPDIARPQGFITKAKSAIVIDHHSGEVLFEKNADTALPPGSMSKLMTLYMAFEAIREGRLSLDERLLVSQHAMNYGGSTLFLRAGERVKVDDLLRGIIVLSGNDACAVIAEALSPDGTEAEFARQMTQRAKELGMTNSHFINSTGWPNKLHFMSIRDLAILADRIVNEFPEFYPMFADKTFLFDGRAKSNMHNRNPLLSLNIGADGLKTGHTEEVGYSIVGSAKQDNNRIIFVLSGLESARDRAEQSELTIEWFRQFAQRKALGKTCADDPNFCKVKELLDTQSKL